MKILRLFLILCLVLVTVPVRSQVSTWAQGFDRSPNAATARAYLGVSTNGTAGVSSFSADPLAGLFNVTVATPTTTPHLSFSLQTQAANVVFAGPDLATGLPTFRSLTPNDLPPSFGGVTNFQAGSASPLFTTSVGNSTFFPNLTFNLPSQSQNLFYASPNGVSGTPTFRSIILGDLPDLTSLIRGKVSGTAPVSYDSSLGIFSMRVADATHDGYLSSSDWNVFHSATGTLTSITNASFGLLGFSLLSSSNPPVPSLKSISAGANITITDNGGTNLSIASSGSSNPGLTDFMQYQTNVLVTYRTVASDVANGAALALNGFGDTISLGFAGSTASALIRQILTGPIPQGPWVELSIGPSANSDGFLGTQSFNTVAPYANGGFYFQTYIFVRNTNGVRINAGFSSAYSTVITADNIITNYAIFRYSTLSNDSTWHGVVCDATNRTFVDTGAPLIPDTGYLLQIYKTNGTTNVVFVVNRTNSVIATSNAPNRVIQTSDLMGTFVGEFTISAALKTNLIRYIGYTVDWVTK